MRALRTFLRMILLVGFLTAMGVLCVWKFQPDWVGQVDAFVVKVYRSYYGRPIKAAQDELRDSPETGVVSMQAAIDRLPKVHKEDTLFHQRQSSLMGLARSFMGLGRFADAEVAAKKVLNADSKNITAHSLWIDTLLAQGDRRAKGMRELAGLAKRFPGQLSIVKKQTELLLAANDLPGAALIAANYLAAPAADPLGGQGLGGVWLGRWTPQRDGVSFDPSWKVQASFMRESDRIDVEFPVRKGQGSLRIDLPASCFVTMRVDTLEAVLEGGARVVSLDHTTGRSHDLVWSGMQMSAQGAVDPWFSFVAPAVLADQAYTLRLRATLMGALPCLVEALRNDTATVRGYQLLEADRPKSAKMMRDLQLGDWVNRGLAFTWQGAEGMTPLNHDSEGIHAFEIEVHGLSGDEVLTFQPAQCLAWELGGLTVSGATLKSVVVGDMTLISDNHWRSFGPGASVQLHLTGPRDSESGQMVQIRGWIK